MIDLDKAAKTESVGVLACSREDMVVARNLARRWMRMAILTSVALVLAVIDLFCHDPLRNFWLNVAQMPIQLYVIMSIRDLLWIAVAQAPQAMKSRTLWAGRFFSIAPIAFTFFCCGLAIGVPLWAELFIAVLLANALSLGRLK